MVRKIEAKSILSKLKSPDPYFGIAYNMNLYRGCQHGCIYCDTRSDCYQVGDIADVAVKQNALELLAKELRSKRNNKATIGTGSMNDPYMPLERELGLTRKALELIGEARFPLHIITKGDLVVSDSDILQEASSVYAAVSFTITCAEDAMAKIIEPNAPSSTERFAAMEQLAAKGIYTGLTLMPVLPFINDTKKNLEELLLKAKDSGASYVIPMFGVTLRKGARDFFYNALEEPFPGVKQRYQSEFGDRYECFSFNYRVLNETFYEMTHKLSLATQMEFFIPKTDKQLSIF